MLHAKLEAIIGHVRRNECIAHEKLSLSIMILKSKVCEYA